MLSFGYCGLDALSTGYQEWANEKGREGDSSREVNAALASFDTLLWQSEF